MYKQTAVVIPALNEADNLGFVVKELRKAGLVNIVVGVDVNTMDETEKVLNKLGIKWGRGKAGGYDGSVAAGVDVVNREYAEVKYILFADAGGKYDFAAVHKMHEMAEEGYKLVLGARIKQKQHMLWHQKLGTQLVLWLINLLFGQKILDISPLRLVSVKLLNSLDMRVGRFSWPSQMLVKVLARRERTAQVPVVLRPRLGKSKVSGSIINSLLAGVEMIGSLRYALS